MLLEIAALFNDKKNIKQKPSSSIKRRALSWMVFLFWTSELFHDWNYVYICRILYDPRNKSVLTLCCDVSCSSIVFEKIIYRYPLVQRWNPDIFGSASDNLAMNWSLFSSIRIVSSPVVPFLMIIYWGSCFKGFLRTNIYTTIPIIAAAIMPYLAFFPIFILPLHIPSQTLASYQFRS